MKQVTLTQVRSAIGRAPEVLATLKALGLGRIGKSKTIKVNPAVDGMIARIKHLIKVDSK